MNAIETLTRILGLSLVSGVNLYATILVVGVSIRNEWVTGLPPELHVLAHPAVLTVAGILYLVEFLADKVPVVASLWDVVHTFIRPVGGALLALAAVSEAHVDPLVQVIAVMAGAAVSLGAHSTKMGFRLVAHAAPHPVLHAGISLAEDVGVVGLLVLIYTHPVAALVVLLMLILGIAIAAPILFRTVLFSLRAVAGRLVFWRPRAGAVPAWLTGMGHGSANGAKVYSCFARSVPRTPRLKKAYLVRRDNGMFLACKGRGAAHPLGMAAGGSERGWLLDVMSFSDPAGGKSSVYLTKDQARRFHADARGPQRQPAGFSVPQQPFLR